MAGVLALRAFAVWVAILCLAIANGVFRQAVLIPSFGTPAALVLSGILLSALILGSAYLALPWLGTRRRSRLWGIGLGWLALTLVFEFSIGLWEGKSWPTMLETYTFKGGNIWPLVLVVVAVAPNAAAMLRNSRSIGKG
jgi:hypothetical protein